MTQREEEELILPLVDESSSSSEEEEQDKGKQQTHSNLDENGQRRLGRVGLKRQKRKARRAALRAAGLVHEDAKKKEMEFVQDHTKNYEAMKQSWNDDRTFEEVEAKSLELMASKGFGEPLTAEEQGKLEEDAVDNWDKFYSRHMDKFFKDRNYLQDVWVELAEGSDETLWQDEPERLVNVMEVGCGAGNTVFPQLKMHPRFHFYASDCSKVAVECVMKRKEYEGYREAGRLDAFVWNMADEALPEETVEVESIDVVTMIFVLSAVHPDKMAHALGELYKSLRPGGSLLFRDYGVFDLSMMRYKKGHLLDDNFFVRGDGTRTFYFSTERVVELFEGAGFRTSSCEYVVREMVNRRRKISMNKVWVNARFVKEG